MEKGYQFHLLNMTQSILICDLAVAIVSRPYHLMPMSVTCFVGELNGILMPKIGPTSMASVHMVIFLLQTMEKHGKMPCKLLTDYFFF
jgi:hypothetical protein